MLAVSLFFTAVWSDVWSVLMVVWSGETAFTAFVKMVVAWVCCAVVNESSEVRRATWLATIVAGSGGVADVSVPNGRCAKSAAVNMAAKSMSLVTFGIGDLCLRQDRRSEAHRRSVERVKLYLLNTDFAEA